MTLIAAKKDAGHATTRGGSGDVNGDENGA